jgi:hypothetical protein
VSPPSPRASSPDATVIKIVATHTAAMVEGLPKDCFAQGLPRAVQYAAIEGFYANVRSLIEFLGVQGIKRRGNSVIAEKIVTGWKPVNNRVLKDHWIAASMHAVHFTKDRFEPFEVDQQALEKVAKDVLAVWDQFAAMANDPLIERSGQFTRYPKGTTP